MQETRRMVSKRKDQVPTSWSANGGLDTLMGKKSNDPDERSLTCQYEECMPLDPTTAHRLLNCTLRSVFDAEQLRST